MSQILLYGESHSVMFQDQIEINHQIYAHNATLDRLLDRSNKDVWDRLDSFLTSYGTDAVLILTVSEIDIRAFYWRHYLRNINVTINDFISNKVNCYINDLELIKKDYGINKIILWGCPPSNKFDSINPEAPFVGSMITQNIMRNLFNQYFIDQIRSRSSNSVAYSTAYYRYIDSETYHPINGEPADCVHFSSSLQDSVWKELITPILDGQMITMWNEEKFIAMKDHDYRLVEEQVIPDSFYNSWIFEEDIPLDAEVQRWTTFNNKQYGYVVFSTNLNTRRELALSCCG